jgi:hypothetical protein
MFGSSWFTARPSGHSAGTAADDTRGVREVLRMSVLT